MHSEHISFPTDGGRGEGYLVLPDGAGPHRAVVVIQEWWGLNEHIKDVANRFAAQGYAALAPDLYHGAVTQEPDEARKLSMELQYSAAAEELAGAAAYLAGRADIAPARVGVIGFCLGGSLALLLAGVSPHVGAVASFYGGRIPTGEFAERLRAITAPFLGIYGAEDVGIPPERREQLASIFRDIGLTYEFQVYPAAPHAFFNDTRPGSYRPAAAADAWRRTLSWFERYLSDEAA